MLLGTTLQGGLRQELQGAPGVLAVHDSTTRTGSVLEDLSCVCTHRGHIDTDTHTHSTYIHTGTDTDTHTHTHTHARTHAHRGTHTDTIFFHFDF